MTNTNPYPTTGFLSALSEERLAPILCGIPLVIYTARPSREFEATWISASSELLSGFPAHRFLVDRELWVSRLHPDDRTTVIERFRDLQDLQNLSIEYRWQHADGSYRWFLDQAVLQRETEGKPILILGTWQDVTERKCAQRQLEQSLSRTRELSRRLEAVREEERSRIAREIHDELGVALTCLKCDLLRLIQAPVSSASIEIEMKIPRMVQLVDDTITMVQRLARELRPQILDDLGLSAALEWLSQDIQQRTGVRCAFLSMTEDQPLSSECATALFRICQEALTNIVRHAEATDVYIGLEEINGNMELEIRDNGKGIANERLNDVKAIGLLGMRERTSLAGGQLSITGVAGQGTIIKVQMPTSQGT
jgi:PAS domain S-box-containing protein